jgi:ABC-type molybdate transport system substrate-binding protein
LSLAPHRCSELFCRLPTWFCATCPKNTNPASSSLVTGDKVEVIEIPEELKVVATYPIGVTREARSPDLAQKWVDLVLSDEGQEVMKKCGFEPVGRS